MKKVLVTGSNGLLGQKLTTLLRQDPQITLVATSRGADRFPVPSDYTYHSLDITSKEEVDRVISLEKPDVIINTAAMTNVDQCEQDHKGCDALNVEAVQYIVAAAEQCEAHLIHLSTDFIFDGKDGPYKEDAPPNPVSYYGHSKLAGEKLVMAAKTDWAIVRTVLVYGVAADMSRSNIVLWARNALTKGQSINVVDDQFRSPTLAEDLAQACWLITRQRAKGIYHISGKDFMSVIELVQRVADFYKQDKSLITPISSHTLNQPAKRPPVTGFVLDKAIQELDYQPHSFEEGLAIVETQLR